MADLDPGLILAGTATTHPTTQIPFGNLVQQAGEVAQTRAQTGLINQEAQEKQLQTQIAAQQYKDQQIIAQSMAGAFSGAKQQAATPNDDGTVNQTPPGVNPKWTVDPQSDQYIDENGNPVSHVDGPMHSPSGRPNMFNSDFINQVTKSAIATGANPATVLSWAQGQIAKGQEFDSKNIEMHKSLQDIRTSQADLQTKQDAHRKAVTDETGNQADLAFQTAGNDPVAQTHAAQQLLRDMPNYWAPRLQAAGVKVAADPQTGMPTADTNNPAFLKTFQAARDASPNATARAKAASEQAAQEASTAKTKVDTQAAVLASAQDKASTGAPLNASEKAALGLTGDAQGDAAKLAAAAKASKAASTAAATTATATETATKVGAAAEQHQQAITGQGSLIQDNQRTIDAIDRLTAKGAKGGKIFNTFGELNNAFGNDPDFAVVKEAATLNNVQRITNILSSGGAGAGSARALGPLLEATKSAGDISKIPLSALRERLQAANDIARSNIDLHTQGLQRTNALAPGAGVAPVAAPSAKPKMTGNLDDVRAYAKKNGMTFDAAYQHLVKAGAQIQ